MIRSEFTDLPPGKFRPRQGIFVVDSGPLLAAPPTNSEVTISDGGIPEIIDVTFTSGWVAI